MHAWLTRGPRQARTQRPRHFITGTPAPRHQRHVWRSCPFPSVPPSPSSARREEQHETQDKNATKAQTGRAGKRDRACRNGAGFHAPRHACCTTIPRHSSKPAAHQLCPLGHTPHVPCSTARRSVSSCGATAHSASTNRERRVTAEHPPDPTTLQHTSPPSFTPSHTHREAARRAGFFIRFGLYGIFGNCWCVATYSLARRWSMIHKGQVSMPVQIASTLPTTTSAHSPASTLPTSRHPTPLTPHEPLSGAVSISPSFRAGVGVGKLCEVDAGTPGHFLQPNLVHRLQRLAGHLEAYIPLTLGPVQSAPMQVGVLYMLRALARKRDPTAVVASRARQVAHTGLCTCRCRVHVSNALMATMSPASCRRQGQTHNSRDGASQSSTDPSALHLRTAHPLRALISQSALQT